MASYERVTVYEIEPCISMCVAGVHLWCSEADLEEERGGRSNLNPSVVSTQDCSPPAQPLGRGPGERLLSLLLPRQALMEEQVNEHLQGHVDEIYHLKQTLACTEEKMAYLSYERAKEIWVRTSWRGAFNEMASEKDMGRREAKDEQKGK